MEKCALDETIKRPTLGCENKMLKLVTVLF